MNLDKNIADCEPSRGVRDQLAADLNVQGQLSCPQKIDMRAIIPTYSLNPVTKTVGRSVYRSGITPLAGFVNYNWQLLPNQACVIPLGYNYNLVKLITLRSLYFQININAAGRAALAAAGENLAIEIHHFIPVGVGAAFVIARGRHQIFANPGLALEISMGSFEQSKFFLGLLSAQFELEIRNFKDYKLLPGEYIEIAIGLLGANFPLLTTGEVTAVFDYEY